MPNPAERLSAIIHTTVDGIIVIDSRGLLETLNPAAERLFGYAEAEVVGHNVSMLMPSPFHEEHDQYLERYQTTGRAAIIGTGREVRGKRKDGSVFPLHLSVGEMFIDGERKFTGVLHDLTQRVALEERLRASEAKWRAVIDSAIDGIIVINTRGDIEAFNPAAARMFGYGEDEVIGKNVKVLMPSPYHEQHDGYLSHYITTGERKIIGSGREVTGLRKDGSTFPLHLSVGETVMEGEHRFTGILHDLTARVAMEEQLREQGALAKLGEMAAVIAHEVKNPLAGIRGVVQVIGKRLPADSTDARMMQEIVSRIDSLDGLMKDLLLFARPPKPQRQSTEIGALVRITADLLRRDQALAGLRIDISGTAPPVTVDPEMIKMVIHNLLINGAHAMHSVGTIRVAISTGAGECAIAVTDGGPGIPADIRDKMFAPFFTTKSKGTGLGLPTAKRFVEAHQGQIVVDCPATGGTTVTVRLPAR
jgi:two-component system sensor kinase FixL